MVVSQHATECMIFSYRQYQTENLVEFGGAQINFSSRFKFLGVTIDNDLSFRSHIDVILKKISKSAGILYRIRNCLPISTRLNFYYAFIYPYITYNIEIWGKTHLYLLDSLFKTQKRVVRTITGTAFSDHTSPIFKELKILKVFDVFKYVVCCHMYKLNNVESFGVPHNYGTRYRNLPRTSRHRLATCQKALSFTGPTEWNNLPNYLREIRTFNSFKKNLKTFLIDQY